MPCSDGCHQHSAAANSSSSSSAAAITVNKKFTVTDSEEKYFLPTVNENSKSLLVRALQRTAAVDRLQQCGAQY